MNRFFKYKIIFFLVFFFSFKSGLSKDISKFIKEYSDDADFVNTPNLTVPEMPSDSATNKDIEDRANKCVWNWDTDFPEERLKPLILDWSNGNNNVIVHPKEVVKNNKKTRQVSVDVGTVLTIACPGFIGNSKKQNYLTTFGDTDTLSAVRAICRYENDLQVGESIKQMKEMGCYQFIKGFRKGPITPPSDQCTSVMTAHYYVIGFDIPTFNEFYPMIGICYDVGSVETPERLLYSSHILYGDSISARDVKPNGGYKWVTDDKDIDHLYTTKFQKEYFGDKPEGQDIELTINLYTHEYFAKGHMSPRADFITQAEQRATYRIYNAVPQWQMFNNMNWGKIEEKIQELAQVHGNEMKIYSGASFEFLMMDNNEIPPKKIEIIFKDSKKPEKTLPVPAFTWKVVHEPSRRKAVAFIGINYPVNKPTSVNPEPPQPPSSNICTIYDSICDKLAWIGNLLDDVDDPLKGITCCLEVDTLRKIVPYVPDLGSVGILE